MLIEAEDGDLQQGHDEKLDRAGFPQNGAEWDQNGRCAEVSVYHAVEKEWWDTSLSELSLLEQNLIKLSGTFPFDWWVYHGVRWNHSLSNTPSEEKANMCLPIDWDFYFSIMHVPDVLE